MKKLYTVLLVLLLGAMSFVGVWSLVDVDAKESARENRRLASFPKITLSSLEDGSFVSQLETYYSDTFPGREALLKANDTLNKFYMFSGATGSNMLVIDFTNDVGEGGQAQEPVKPEQGEEPPEVTPEDPPEVPVEEDPPVQEEERKSMEEFKFKSFDDLPLTLTVMEVAEALRISRAGAYDLVRTEGFPALKIGSRIVIPKDQFIEWMRENTGKQN